LGGGLILKPNGDGWKWMRSLVAPAFKYSFLQKVSALVISHAEILSNSLEGVSEPKDMQEEFQKLTFDVIGNFVLGINFRTQFQEKSEYYEAWNFILEHLSSRLLSPIPYWKFITTPGVAKYSKAINLIESTISDSILKKEKDPQLENSMDLLSFFLQERKRGSDITDTEIKNELLTFLFAGHDTTTNLLTWALYFLALHPTIQSKTQQEVDAVIKDGKFSHEEMNKMKYLKFVIKETLRLRPSVPLRSRLTKEDDIVCGWKIKKGTEVSWNAYELHHDPEYWPNPFQFDPDRWLVEGDRHPYSYLPFGGGPRKCIGEQLALNEASAVLAVLISRFHFKLLEGHPVEDVTFLTMRAKHGIKMWVSKR